MIGHLTKTMKPLQNTQETNSNATFDFLDHHDDGCSKLLQNLVPIPQSARYLVPEDWSLYTYQWLYIFAHDNTSAMS